MKQRSNRGYTSIRYITLSILSFLSCATVASAQKTVPQESSFRMASPGIEQQRLIIYDASSLPLDDISRSRDDNKIWVVGKIEPGDPVLAATFKEDSTGKFIRISTNSETAAFYEGKISILSTLTGKENPLREENYQLGSPVVFTSRTHPMYNSPLRTMGTLVFQIDTRKQGTDRYSPPYYRIPESLAPFVLPAVAYYKKTPLLHEDYGTGKRSDEDVKTLKGLLTNDNPILANAAFQLLAREDKLPSDWLEQNLSTRSPLEFWRQSLFVTTVLLSCPTEKRDSQLKYVAKRIDVAKTPEQVAALFLGIHIGMRNISETKGILLRANRRVDALQAGKKPDEHSVDAFQGNTMPNIKDFFPHYGVIR